MKMCPQCHGDGSYLVQRGYCWIDEPTRETCIVCKGVGQLSHLAYAIEKVRSMEPPKFPVLFT